MLKVFQLRVARSVLGLGVRDIGAYIDLSRSTISKIERKEITSNLNIKENQCVILIKIFNDKKVFFSDDTSVSYERESKHYNEYLTRFQLRGGRAILGLSQREMSEQTGIEKNVLNYLENLSNSSLIYKIKENQGAINSMIKEFFYKNNVHFPTENTMRINS